jgi:hypothetical protein
MGFNSALKELKKKKRMKQKSTLKVNNFSATKQIPYILKVSERAVRFSRQPTTAL